MSKRRAIIISLAGIGLAYICLHIAGYKLYGSPEIRENKPLDHPTAVARVEPPNRIVLEDGRKLRMRRVQVLSVLKASNRPHWAGAGAAPWLIEITSSTPEGVTSDARAHLRYFCGNTFFPRFLPESLPAYGRIPLADQLASYGVALPTLKAFETDHEWATTMVRHLRIDALRLPDQVSRQHAVMVGDYLIGHEPDLTDTGFKLLARAQDPQLVQKLTRQIHRMRSIGYENYMAQFNRRIVPLFKMLLDQNHKLGMEYAHRVVRAGSGNPYLQVKLAWLLFSQGDRSDIDWLMGRIENHDDETYVNSIAGDLILRFQFASWQSIGSRARQLAMVRWWRDQGKWIDLVSRKNGVAPILIFHGQLIYRSSSNYQQSMQAYRP